MFSFNSLSLKKKKNLKLHRFPFYYEKFPLEVLQIEKYTQKNKQWFKFHSLFARGI